MKRAELTNIFIEEYTNGITLPDIVESIKKRTGLRRRVCYAIVHAMVIQWKLGFNKEVRARKGVIDE